MDVGDSVMRVGGDYAFDGTVVCVFEKLNGGKRIVVESVLIPGLLHIFAPDQLFAVRRGIDETPA